MAELDHGIKMIAETAGWPGTAGQGGDHPLAAGGGNTVQVLRRAAAWPTACTSRVVGRARRFAVYFEFYTTWDRDAPWDMLAKSGLISERERLPTVCIAVVLRRAGFRTTGGGLRLEAAGGPTQQLWLREVPLWQIRPEAWWRRSQALMALYPLCQHGWRPR